MERPQRLLTNEGIGMKDVSYGDIHIVLNELVQQCEGAMMAGKYQGFLWNFSSSMHDRLNGLANEIERSDEFKAEKND